MGKNKIGRNDRCPCGSQKKYKHCCMIKEEVKLIINSDKSKYFDAEKQVTEVILKFVNSKENESDFNNAILEYFGAEFSEININDAEFNFFIAWYIKNYNYNNPVIDKIIKIQNKSGSNELKELLKALKASNLFLYKIIEIKDNKIIFKNLHNSSCIEIIDESIGDNVNIGDVVYTRIYKVGKYNKLFGGSMLIPYFIVEELLISIDEAWNNSNKDIEYNDFIQVYSIELIKKLNSDIPDNRILYNDDDEFLQYSITQYKMLDKTKCNFILENDDEFEKKENDINILYQWIKKDSNKNFVMAEITLSENHLKVETDSFERKERLQKLLENKLKGLIEFIDENYLTISQLQEQVSDIKQLQTNDEIERLLFDNMKIDYTNNQIKQAILLAKYNKFKLKRLKPESIASSIEYTIVLQYNISKTQKEIADKYNVSPATIGKWSKEIQLTQ